MSANANNKTSMRGYELTPFGPVAREVRSACDEYATMPEKEENAKTNQAKIDHTIMKTYWTSLIQRLETEAEQKSYKFGLLINSTNTKNVGTGSTPSESSPKIWDF